MFNRKIFLLSAIVLATGSALADWQRIGSNGGEFALYADLDTVNRNGAIVSVQQIVTYGESQPARITGRRYMSEKSLVEYDCASKRARTLSTEQYSGDRASGYVVYRDINTRGGWEFVPYNTNMEVIWKRSCDRA